MQAESRLGFEKIEFTPKEAGIIIRPAPRQQTCERLAVWMSK
jgi:hypothetical protein